MESSKPKLVKKVKIKVSLLHPYFHHEILCQGFEISCINAIQPSHSKALLEYTLPAPGDTWQYGFPSFKKIFGLVARPL